MNYLEKGDLILVNLNPVKGHEQAGMRPAMIVSNNGFNKMCNGMYKIVPITSKIKDFPLNINLPEGLPVHGQLLLSQEKAIDLNSRPHKKVGKAPADFVKEVDRIIALTY
ncbi:type II toxin-antitoxin system PemK/MazF family toxin [Lactobacillus sp. PV034]|uniref:type II toxin-antitoxin system PemK/MazF family toxin n=1 Tax=Lactobacillus sp. PV034 TaxID=2594495 RepID=UPI002240504E|nr:type II toxin-antitoxin system PemK/MazF family toxin [Lactobacillus sp. PV034]QNQ81103.1 type II toxin-antitoxin system PemK/MazF family toxin [Lactobacillus sp. PV034]